MRNYCDFCDCTIISENEKEIIVIKFVVYHVCRDCYKEYLDTFAYSLDDAINECRT